MMKFNEVFPNGDDSLIIPNGEKIIIAAIDAEWWSNYTMNTNLILSYQFSAVNLLDGSRGDGIYYTNYREKERLSFTNILEQIAKTLGLKLTDLREYLVIIVAHNAVAEWTTIKDRKKIVGKLQFIRKTVITPGYRPIELDIYDKSRNKIELEFMIKDTMLLLPEKYRSLKKASALVDPEFAKIDIGQDKLSNMLKFLEEEPEVYEAYAIRDTQVTLSLWISLQSQFNSINNTKEIIYSTLSSASLVSYAMGVHAMEETISKSIRHVFKQRW